MYRKFLALLVIVQISAACTPSRPGAIPTTSPVAITEIPDFIPTFTPVPESAAVLDQMVDVGGYKLRMICTGEGTPTVVVDAALGEAALESGVWLRSRYELEKTTRICAYDRAGLGSSEAAPTQYRTSQEMVKDLHTLLVNAAVPGPYVLVGQDLGGLNVRLYASQYPDEVAGMVLVDAIHPDFHTETVAVLPPESQDEPANLHGLRLMLTDFVVETPEGVDLNASAEQVRATGSLGDLPLIVLTQRSGLFVATSLSPDVRTKMEQVWQDLQVDLARLSSNSTHVIGIADSQNTPADKEQQIIDAILRVVEQAKR